MSPPLALALVALLRIPVDAETSRKRAEAEAREREMSDVVWVTTDRAVVDGCSRLGGIGMSHGNSLDRLRRLAAERGADVVRLRSLKDDGGLFAELYRCAEWDPLNPPTPTPTPTDQQRASRELMTQMKARIRIVEDPLLVSGCEKMVERSVNMLEEGEDLLRGHAVGSRSNVILLRRFQGSMALGELFRCSPSDFRALPSPTPTNSPTPAP